MSCIEEPIGAHDKKVAEKATVGTAAIHLVHVQLFAPGVAEAAASIKVDVQADGVVALLYDYPDLKPAVGWRITGGVEGTITAVDGKSLTVKSGINAYDAHEDTGV